MGDIGRKVHAKLCPRLAKYYEPATSVAEEVSMKKFMRSDYQIINKQLMFLFIHLFIL